MAKEISVRLGSINYACAISDGHHQWIIDEPVAKGGGDTAPDPYTALLASIGSCSAITLKMYAQHKGWEVEDVEIKMSLDTKTEMGKKRSVFTRNVLVKGKRSSEQLIRLQQIVIACPISKLLEGEIAITTEITNVSDESPVIINEMPEII